MTFQELNISKQLLNALNELGFTEATPIQQEAFPAIMSGKDLVGIAQTGTGKTFAYLLPILRQLTFSDQRNPRVLIVVPTRELVVQVVEEVEKLTEYMSVRINGVYGGTNINTQKERVIEGQDILVATPGRLLDLALSGELRLRDVKKFVIDEVDEMLNLGFRPQLIRVMDLLPEKRQNLMFSATMDREIDEIIDIFFNLPNKIEIVPTGTPLDKIAQQAYHVPNFNTKINLLEKLLLTDDTMDKVLVFVESKKLADKVFEQMSKKFPDQFGVIHSNKSQNLRFATIDKFQDGLTRVLIATDIISRGLDITDVTHVINFDTPVIATSYIHRIGRTGRAEKEGVAITFINQAEEEFQGNIEKMMQQPIPMMSMPDDIEISDVFADHELPKVVQKDYLRDLSKKQPKESNAYHEKKEKNKKVNLGGSYRRELAKKYKKPKTRGMKNQGKSIKKG